VARRNRTKGDARAVIERAREADDQHDPSLEYLRWLQKGLHVWLEYVDDKIAEVASARRYEVVASNVGTVYDGHDRDEAEEVFEDYVQRSRGERGRASHEDVVLYEDDEPIAEHYADQD